MQFVDNNAFETATQPSEAEVTATKSAEMKRELFASLHVAGESYKLKLTPPEIMELEKVYKCNLINMMGDADNIPTITTMLQITHAAAKKWQHGLKIKDIERLYEHYIAQGGNMLQFYLDTYMRIFAVSGFFSQSMGAELTDSVEKMTENM